MSAKAPRFILRFAFQRTPLTISDGGSISIILLNVFPATIPGFLNFFVVKSKDFSAELEHAHFPNWILNENFVFA